MIPIEESMLYIRPLYLRSAGGRIPELKRVIVAYQNRIVMEETLERALNRIFPPGGGSTAVTGLLETTAGPTARPGAPEPEPGVASAPSPPATVLGADASREQLSAEALATYQRALAAQREGNWALYGEEIRRLGDLLERLSKLPQE